MMRAVAVLLALGLLGGCTTTQTPAPGVTAQPTATSEEASRPLRLAYSVKFLQYVKNVDEVKDALRKNLGASLLVLAQRYNPKEPEQLVAFFRENIVPEIERRLPEITDLLAEVFADTFTTDEMRRLSDLVSLPASLKMKDKKPLTDQELAEVEALRPLELMQILESKQSAIKELARVRGEVWGLRLVEELIARNPEKFRQKAI
ncbi:hypothetical protein GCM10011497_22590 [Elstera cyanobacteriorum]|uniref:DUF2059 domain-containing protein n=1 Tax=Elstera cyanobacteriorum TaxID=2022747 RepID=A0A255XR89_9PROT|nr:hypothetical protein [Elstera cyanobacteriorum]OYQ19516.1 hypothetical protein CHR90_08865 [Elstera cyanobacteriorum]GFZ92090.1 hypothetical protein GCM10011497_22590 [Elstera cyanobacteriorum]